MRIAIQGHPFRGKEVIQILKSLGGKSIFAGLGFNERYYYYINFNDMIRESLITIKTKEEFKLYTLEEFEKEFPFKVGDKVTIVGLPDFPKTITKIEWDCDEILYSFEDLNNTWFGAKALKKFEMKEERNVTLTLDKAKEWYNKGGELKEIALQAFSEKELTKVELPKTWEEFCNNYPMKGEMSYIDDGSNIKVISSCNDDDFRDIVADRNMCPSKKSAEAHLAMIQLEQLRDCWRQDWKPKWMGESEKKYAIKAWRNEYTIQTTYNTHEFLTFPTYEMAEEFLKYFRDLIEKASDLI